LQTYLVTGGAGFIGSNLVEALLRQGKTVRVFDNLATGKRENLTPFLSDIEFVEGDICDLDRLHKAMQGVEVVLHQAALASVPRSVADPVSSNEVNVGGTLNVLLAARDAGVQRVVYASSSSIYGNSLELPKVETMAPDPLSPYAVAKLAGEHYCRTFTAVYGLPAIALRYFNVFGPRQDPNSQYAAVIPKFITMMLHGEPPVIDGDGGQSRDFTYIDNVVAGNLLAAEAPADVSGYFNCACGDRFTLLDLVARINEILGTSIVPQHGPPRPGDVRDSQAGIAKIEQALGYHQVTSFADGLAKTIAYFRSKEG
jgi:UDP-glucose 4-epimerase